MSRHSRSDVQAAVDRAHRNESERLDANTEGTLRRELDRVWTLIRSKPNDYIMNETEFAVFNRYRGEDRYQNQTAQKAVERYWNNRRAVDGV